MEAVSIVVTDRAAAARASAALAGAGIPARAGRPRMLVADGPGADAQVESVRAAADRGQVVVAVLPDDAANGVLRRVLIAGAAGIVLAGELERALPPSVRAVAAGQLAVPARLRRRLAPRPLSYREKQVLKLVVDGYTNRQIADALVLAESTVKTHVSSAFTKLDARSRAEAAARILDPDEGLAAHLATISAGAGRPAR
jgi:DNA-binding NarL/FixJ family response regulator